MLAVPDHSPKSAEGSHPVFKFESFADVAGQPIKAPDGEPGEATTKGVVQAWYFARHGEPNGVILETSEFIHLRPHGMVVAGLDIGSKVNAMGELRMTVLGMRRLEALRVNRVDLAWAGNQFESRDPADLLHLPRWRAMAVDEG